MQHSIFFPFLIDSCLSRPAPLNLPTKNCLKFLDIHMSIYGMSDEKMLLLRHTKIKWLYIKSAYLYILNANQFFFKSNFSSITISLKLIFYQRHLIIKLKEHSFLKRFICIFLCYCKMLHSLCHIRKWYFIKFIIIIIIIS